MAARTIEQVEAENRELRAYLKAFCAATVDPDDCGKDVQRHEANPFIEYEFGLVNEGVKPGRVITGGQVRRAMELVGFDKLKIEAPESTIAEELTEARDLREKAKELDRWHGLFDAIRQIIGEPEGWPSHGNAPLALAAKMQLLQMDIARLTTPRPLDEWHEDDGFVLWWKLPVEEPPYSGSPHCDDWPGGYTHWTRMPEVCEP